MGSYSEGIKQVFKETRDMVKKEPKFQIGDRVVGTHKAYLHRGGKRGQITEVSSLHYWVLWEGETEDHLVRPEEISKEVLKESQEDSAEYPQDTVNHPSHYNQDGIEAIEAIRASLGPDGFQAYCKGNCMKYLWRYKYKNGVEDLKKAQVYLNWMVEGVEK